MKRIIGYNRLLQLNPLEVGCILTFLHKGKGPAVLIIPNLKTSFFLHNIFEIALIL